jgi:hypothetical protein
MSGNQKHITGAEFRALFEPLASVIAASQVGFALVSIVGNAEDATLGGSGTLVTIDDYMGILTADHVVRNFFKHKEKGAVGLILAQHGEGLTHKLLINPKPEECIVFRRLPYSAEGPDLAFVPLDHETIGAVKPKKTLYNLTKRRERMLSNPPATEMGAWLISGMAHEWTKDAADPSPFAKKKIFKGMIGEVRLASRKVEKGLDYQSIYAMVEPESGWPQSYEGYSGTGVWQILVKEVDGHLQIGERLLSCVAFYESASKLHDGKPVRELMSWT